MKQRPSGIARKILRWFVNTEFVEEIEGDLDELFQERLSRQGRLKAHVHYLLDVIHAIRPYSPKRKSTKIAHEISSGIFLKLAVRNLQKRKAFSAINIFGLSVGLASFLLILEYVAFERSYDSFHERYDNIYRVAFNWGETDYTGVNSSIYASSVPALGPALVREIPEFEGYTRFVPVLTVKSFCVFARYENGKLRYSGNADNGLYADSAFLKIFSFPMLVGDDKPLSKPRSLVLTRSFATRIFGDIPLDEVVGATVSVDAQGGGDHVVTGILEDVPSNSHIQFDYLISYSTINSDGLEGNLGWSQFYTYILSSQSLTHSRIEPKFKSLLEKLYGTESRISIFLQPLKEIYLTSDLREEMGTSGSAKQLTFLTIIAYTILFMAWFNYINMFLARSIERVNEVGIKKILGSTRAHLVIQFFAESMLITGISIVTALILTLLLQGPFEVWLGKEISNVSVTNFSLTAITFIIVLAGSVLAGLYPAFVLSSHNPLQVVGRKFRSSGQGQSVYKSLIHFQFIVSFTVVACTLLINRQISFMKEANLGMNLGGRVALRSPGGADSTYENQLETYRQRLLAYPFVKNFSVTSSIPGKPITTSGGVQRVIGPALEGNNVFFVRVDGNFLNTYNIRLIAGKNFSDNHGGIPAILLNEAAVQILKYESPQEALNHRIHWQGKEFEIIGVFANYNHLFLKEAFEPIILSYRPATQGFITLQIEEGYFERAIALAEKEMHALFPGAPFEYDFLESTYEHQYRDIQKFEQLTKYFAVLAIVIACTGLFALSYYSAQRRIKEVAVRKIFGARVYDVLLLLSTNYLKVTILSGLIGSALTFYLMQAWLQNFAFAVHIDFRDFLVPLATIIIISLLTISYNCLKVSLANPSQSLKHDL